MFGNDQINKFMNTPMSRKQFLRYMGVMLLSVMGVGNVISGLLQAHNKSTQGADQLKSGRGFGGGKYGGE